MKKVIVVDTNVFVAALLSAEGASREIIRRCIKKQYLPLMGVALFYEYEDLMSRSNILDKSPLSPSEVEILFNAFLSVCKWIHIYFTWRPNLRDENDNHILELAVAGNADAIITHNIKDFAKSELNFQEVEIIRPLKFLEVT